MNFSDAIIFVAAIFIVVGSGVLLGLSLRRKPATTSDQLVAGKAALYAEIAQSIDGLNNGSPEHKSYFMQRYYQSLIYASDEVIKQLNTFLDTGADAGPADQELVRDHLLLAMRRDVQALLGASTTLLGEDLYRIELKHEARADTPEEA